MKTVWPIFFTGEQGLSDSHYSCNDYFVHSPDRVRRRESRLMLRTINKLLSAKYRTRLTISGQFDQPLHENAAKAVVASSLNIAIY